MNVNVEGDVHDQIPEPDQTETIEEYLDRVNSLLSQTNRVITSVKIDGNRMTDEDTRKNCEEINHLNIRIQEIENLVIQSIAEMGSYCQRYVSRLTSIIDDWENYSSEKVDEYRDQVTEALTSADEVLNSIETLLNINLEDDLDKISDEMMDRVDDLRVRIRNSSDDELRDLLKNSVKDFIVDLFDGLREVLDQLEEREETLKNDLNVINEQLEEMIPDLEDAIDRIKSARIEKGLTQIAEHVDTLFKTKLTLNRFDKTGRFKKLFSPDEQSEIKETLKKINTGTEELAEFLKTQDYSSIVKELEENILPYLRNTSEYFKTIMDYDSRTS